MERNTNKIQIRGLSSSAFPIPAGGTGQRLPKTRGPETPLNPHHPVGSYFPLLWWLFMVEIIYILC